MKYFLIQYKNRILVVIVTLAVASLVFFYLQYREGQSFLNQSQLNQPSPDEAIKTTTAETMSTKSGQLTENEQPAPSPAKLRVTIYNGTSTKGLAKQVQDSLKSKFDSPREAFGEAGQMEFVGVGNTKGDFAKTVVVDLSGKNAAVAKTIGGEVKGQVVDKLPAGETAPESDILIILGSDYGK